MRVEESGLDYEEIERIVRAPQIFTNLDPAPLLAGQQHYVFSTEEDKNVPDFGAFSGDLEDRVDDVYYESSEQYQARRSEFVNKRYAELAKEMDNVSEDGLIKKKVITEGKGELVGATDLVSLDYQLFFEHSSNTFDSTQHSRKRIRVNRVLPGLSLALTTMRAGELSYFLIHHSLAYGELGHLPRVKPKAQILAEIEVHKIITPRSGGGAEMELGDELSDGRRLKDEANRLFKNEHYAAAIPKYAEAVNIVSHIVADTLQMKVEKRNLLKDLRLNLAITYIKTNKYEQAEYMCRLVLRSWPDDLKAMLRCGRALMCLNKFDEARQILLDARQLHPSSKEIEIELGKVEVVMRAAIGAGRLQAED